MSTKRVEIELPFAGFYESWHDDDITQAVESNFQDDEGEITSEMSDKIWSADIDWSAIRLEYCKAFVSNFADEFGLDLQFAEMTSPREYNFTSDRLFVSIPKEQIDKIRAEVEQSDTWADYVKERYTSRDGFWSHYDSDIKHEDWTADVLDECQYKTMIECWLELKHKNDPNNVKEWNDLEWELATDIEVYGFSSVIDAINEVEKLITTEAK
jgi:hypothetical protein